MILKEKSQVKDAQAFFFKKEVTKDFCDYLFSLYYRYQDEKEYEDFDDYIKAMKKNYPNVKTMTKRPFGVVWSEEIRVEGIKGYYWSLRTYVTPSGGINARCKPMKG